MHLQGAVKSSLSTRMANSIPFGSPHVLRAHMWALSTRGGPNEIKKNTHPKTYHGSFRDANLVFHVEQHGARRAVRDEARSTFEKKRAVKSSVSGGQLDFVWLPARTEGPHGGASYVWCLTA